VSSKPAISVWCPRHHLMQKFRWVVSEGVWQPMHLQSEIVAVYPGGPVRLMPVPAERDEDWTFPPLADHQRWPVWCRECKIGAPVRDDRMTTVLEGFHRLGVTEVGFQRVHDDIERVSPTSTTRRYPLPDNPFHRRDP